MMAHEPHPKPSGGCRRRHCALWLAGLAAAPLAGCAAGGLQAAAPAADSYASAMRRALRSVAGDLPEYQFRTTPVGHFGVGSIYIDELAGSDLRRAESSWYLGGPEAWLAPGARPAERDALLRRLVSEGSMGAVDIDSGGGREVHLQAGMALVSALTVNAGFDSRSAVETRLRATELRQRRLNWAEFQAALRGGQIAPDVADVVRGGRFIIAAADVLLLGYRAEITVDESRSPAIAAGLRTNVLLPSRAGGGIGLRVAESARGRFVVTAPQHVVAAVLLKRPPPAAKDLGAAMADVATWPTAAVSERAVAAVEFEVLGQRGARR